MRRLPEAHEVLTERERAFVLVEVRAGDRDRLAVLLRRQAGHVARGRFLADDDTSVIDEELIKLGVRWRFLKSKGLEYAEDFRQYEARVETAIVRDGAPARVNMGGTRRGSNIPEGSWNVS